MERCQLKMLVWGKKRGFFVLKLKKKKYEKDVERILGKNLFSTLSYLFLEPELEAFKPSACRSKSLFTDTDLLS